MRVIKRLCYHCNDIRELEVILENIYLSQFKVTTICKTCNNPATSYIMHEKIECWEKVSW